MNETSLEIIKMLRAASLGWVADEIIESLALGKQMSKEFREPGATRSSRATAIEPFSSEEELELIVETLAQYFIVTPAAWSAARSYFAQGDTFTEVPLDEKPRQATRYFSEQERGFAAAIGITSDGDGAFQEFRAGFEDNTRRSLQKVLRQLWPRGAEDFQIRFGEEGLRKR